MEVDMTERIMCRHVMTYAHATWRMHVYIYIHLINRLNNPFRNIN